MLQSLTFTQFGQGPQPIATDLLINMQDGFLLKYYVLQSRDLIFDMAGQEVNSPNMNLTQFGERL